MFQYSKSSMTGSISGVMKANLQQTFNPLYTDTKTKMLEGLVENSGSPNSKINLNEIYREIYLMDTICGPTVDMMCNLPWSDYSLGNVKDKKVLKIYKESLDELDLVSLMTQLSVSFLVLGEVVASLIFNESKGIFTDVICQNPDDCEIEEIPLRGYDPKIDLKVSKAIKKFLNSSDPRDQEARKEIPSKLLSKLMSNSKIPLEPLSTLYLARSYVPGIRSVSYFHRIVPIWLIEKALMRGTIIGAWRRQRSILHVTAGNEEWQPTAQQIQELGTLFNNADNSPQGAVVVTRPDIQTSEIRNGGDFWKVSDEIDLFSTAKMRSLGISDSFLSGDSNYNTMDVSLSVFMENLRTFRANMTRDVLTNKIFLNLAKVHGFKKRTEAELTHRIRISASRNTSDLTNYHIPTVKWAKDLRSKYDQSYIDILSSVEEKGVPIPLVLYANAAGLTKDEVLSSFNDDVEFRKEVKRYNDKLKESGIKSKEEEPMFSSFKSKNRRFNSLKKKGKIPREVVLNSKQFNKLMENKR